MQHARLGIGRAVWLSVVSGLAALLMSYYPSLEAADVKRIIRESSTKLASRQVARPGGGTATFGTLSVTGGVVNAVAAVRMAEEMTRVTP